MFSWLQIMVFMTAAGSPPACEVELSDLFLYAVNTHTDALYRLSWAKPAEQLHPDGTIGWPAIDTIGWDSSEGRLYGYDRALGDWIEIDLNTGIGFQLANIQLPPNYGLGYYPTIRRFVYAQGHAIMQLDPRTGESSELFHRTGINFDMVVFVRDAVAHKNGLLTRGSNGWAFHAEPNYQSILLNADAQSAGCHRLFPANDYTMILCDRGHEAAILNKVSATTTVICSGPIQNAFAPMVLVEPFAIGPPSPVCRYIDADSDGDIDLRDWADVQNCFGGPNE